MTSDRSGLATFRLDTLREPAARFHARDLLAEPAARVVECRATRTTLVLGSAQRADVVVDAGALARRGIDVTQRRSGGGAVLVEPDGLVWFDVVVPAGDRRFAAVSAGVRESMVWIGTHIRRALEGLGVRGLAIHDGSMNCGDWCRLVCFAGTAAGEVTHHGRKLVGISQRRTRAGSRFQCAVHVRWNPELLISLLAPPRPALVELAGVAALDATVADELPAALTRILHTP